MSHEHVYQITVEWTGNTGKGTEDYRTYERAHRIATKGKPEILASSDPIFRGDAKRWNPEEFLLSAIASCHMLSYLHLCATNQIVVTAYLDNPVGIMVVETTGIGAFQEVTLHPEVTIENSREDDALRLHHDAHERCFVANSVNFPVNVIPKISIK